MSPWAVVAGFLIGGVAGFMAGVIVGMASERLNRSALEQQRQLTSTTELERLRARRAHPTSKPNPWN